MGHSSNVQAPCCKGHCTPKPVRSKVNPPTTLTTIPHLAHTGTYPHILQGYAAMECEYLLSLRLSPVVACCDLATVRCRRPRSRTIYFIITSRPGIKQRPPSLEYSDLIHLDRIPEPLRARSRLTLFSGPALLQRHSSIKPSSICASFHRTSIAYTLLLIAGHYLA